MKKVIALLLALIMTFSVATVAFATEGEVAPEAPETETTTPEEGETDVMGSIEDFLGEYDWILDLPFGTVKPALKVAKIALKLVLVYVKICDVFGLDPMETAQGIFEYISEVAEQYKPETEAPETEAPEAAPAA